MLIMSTTSEAYTVVSGLMHSSTPETNHNTGTEAGSLLIIKTYS